MAYHKMTLIGKLVSDPKFRPFDNGGGVAKFGLPVNFTRPKKNPATGEWEGESFIIDVDVFNRDNYKLADIVMQSLRKGSQVYVEGRLKPNEYTDKNGVRVMKPVLVADVVEFLDPRQEGMGGGGISAGGSAAPRMNASTASRSSFGSGGGSVNSSRFSEPAVEEPGPSGGAEEEIPF